MGRDEDIQAIVEVGRRTRQPVPRSLWIVAAAVGAICVVCFAAMMLGDREPPRPRPSSLANHRPEAGTGLAGLGSGLVIGAGLGIVIGLAIGRQRRSHSSRNRP